MKNNKFLEEIYKKYGLIKSYKTSLELCGRYIYMRETCRLPTEKTTVCNLSFKNYNTALEFFESIMNGFINKYPLKKHDYSAFELTHTNKGEIKRRINSIHFRKNNNKKLRMIKND